MCFDRTVPRSSVWSAEKFAAASQTRRIDHVAFLHVLSLSNTLLRGHEALINYASLVAQQGLAQATPLSMRRHVIRNHSTSTLKSRLGIEWLSSHTLPALSPPLAKMPGVGPELPPHLLAKKKRQREEAEAAAKNADASTVAAAIPDREDKKRRVIGPTMPPAPIEERPNTPPTPPRKADEQDDSSSEDDFGPAVPVGDESEATSAFDRKSLDNEQQSAEPKQLKHDDWMLHPPTQDDLAARLDPTRRRPNKFGSGKGNTTSDSSMWHETPEEKRKRLANEVLGVSETAGAGSASSRASNKNDVETRRKIDEYNAKNRSKSLYEMHEGKRKKEGKDDEDDPSKRAFDREKDIGGRTLNYTQRKQVLNRASNLGSKFSGGGYL